MDDEIKLAGLEALVPEGLENHLTRNSNRLRTFEDARLEIVTYVAAKFGLRIRDSKPSDTASRGHSDPTDVDAVNSLASGKGKRVIESTRWLFQVWWSSLSTRRQCSRHPTERQRQERQTEKVMVQE